MQSKSYEIEAVLFDADGVLQRSSIGWLDSVKRLCGDPARSQEFVEDVFDAEAPSLIGQGDFRSALAEVLERWSSCATLEEALAVWTMIEPEGLVIKRVRALRRNHTIVALATNQQKQRADYMLADLGYEDEFDHFFVSCHIGCAKPSQAYFEHVLEALQLGPSQVLFIDDHLRNVEAAHAVGLQAEQFHLDQGMSVLDAVFARYRLRTGDL